MSMTEPDITLWIEHRRSNLPMTARAYATEIMEDLKRAGMSVQLHTRQGYSTQDSITAIVEVAMAKAVERYKEEKWWHRLIRAISGREWP